MQVEDICKLIQAVDESSLTEFIYEEEGVKLVLDKKHPMPPRGPMPPMPPMMPQPMPQETAPQAVMPAQVSAAEMTGNEAKPAEMAGNVVTSPLVGVFYAAPSEEASPFVKVGDHVEAGQTVAIVEAMKLMNEIESEFTGTVKEVLVKNGQSVEYGQPLFRVE